MILNQLFTALANVLAHRPELWGDRVVNGITTFPIDEDALFQADRALAAAGRLLRDPQRPERLVSGRELQNLAHQFEQLHELMKARRSAQALDGDVLEALRAAGRTIDYLLTLVSINSLEGGHS